MNNVDITRNIWEFGDPDGIPFSCFVSMFVGTVIGIILMIIIKVL